MNAALAWIEERLEGSDWRRAWTGYVLLAPALLILVPFVFYPIGASAVMSLHGGKYGRGGYVGFANYVDAVQQPDFWNSLSITFYYALGVVPGSLVLGFALAYAARGIVVGRLFFRTAFFLPYVTSAVAAAMVWRAALNPQTGAANMVMHALGLPAQTWLLEPRGVLHLLSSGWIPADVGPSLALCCIMVFDVWHNLGFVVIVLLAALAAIPRELEEAALIDGAGALRRVRHIVIPLVSPALLFLTVVGLIQAFQAFNSFYALTQGGARTLGTTENLVMLVYANFYEYGYWGFATAVATLLTAILVTLTFVQWRVLGRKVFYE